MSSINYLVNKLHTYPITEEAKKKEVNTITAQYTTTNII
jgi:hypothetical protein